MNLVQIKQDARSHNIYSNESRILLTPVKVRMKFCYVSGNTKLINCS